MQDTASLRSYGGTAAAHSHGYAQIVVPLSGCLDMEVDGLGGRVTGTTMALVAAGREHCFAAVGENGFLVLDTSADIESMADGAPFVPMHPDLQQLSRAVAPRLMSSRPAGDEYLRHLAGLFLSTLAETGGSAVAPSAAVQRAIDCLQKRFAEPLTVGDVAAAAGLRPSRLQECFRQATGSSVHAWLLRLRAEAAMRLLAESDLDLAEIALATGHADQSALNRNLRRHADVTPAAYRRAMRRHGGGSAG